MPDETREVSAYVVEEETRIYVQPQEDGGRLLAIKLGDYEWTYFYLAEEVPLILSAPHSRALNKDGVPEGPTIKEMVDFWNEHHPRET